MTELIQDPALRRRDAEENRARIIAAALVRDDLALVLRRGIVVRNE